MSDPLFQELLARLERDLEPLPDKPDETPQGTLACLWALAEGKPLALCEVDPAGLGPLDEAGRQALRALVERRLAGVPLAHLTGRQDFMGVVLLASPEALVPRRETEILGRGALAKVRACDRAEPRVVDLCTGCGNVALAIAVNAPQARVCGSDLAPEAVALARRNAEFLGRPDVTFVVGDLAAPFDNEDFRGRIDVLTCNPPYISSAKVGDMAPEIARHEPRLAFDGGPFGIRILQRLLQDAPRLVRPGGWLLFEVGLGQGEPMRKRLAGMPAFTDIEAMSDGGGAVRALAARIVPVTGA